VLVTGHWREPVMSIERLGDVVDGIDDDIAAAKVTRPDSRPGQCAGQKLRAKTLVMQVLVERESSDEETRDPIR